MAHLDAVRFGMSRCVATAAFARKFRMEWVLKTLALVFLVKSATEGYDLGGTRFAESVIM